MADRPVRLVLNDNFTANLTRAAEVVRQMTHEWALRDATWEPHNWSDWED